MDVLEAIRLRRSIRAYQDRPVEEEKLARVLEAARLAPSAKNIQNWHFIVVRDAKTRRRLAMAAKGQAFLAQAPVIIAACGTQTDYIMTCGQAAYSIDVAIAVDHMTLAAVSEGLGSCWIGAFFQEEVKEILGIPADVQVVALLPLGYPLEQPIPTLRKEREEIVSLERWS